MQISTENLSPIFCDIAQLLLDLTKKERIFPWSEDHHKYFKQLKELFVTALILVLYDPDKETILEVDCSGYVMGACLSQLDDMKVLRAEAYYSRKLTPAESNNEIHDKELLAVISALEEWRGELMGLRGPFTVLSDHKNLQNFMTTRKLSERQVRWSYILSQYNFILRFRAGKDAARPDSLSRREQDMPKNEEDDRLKSREFKLLKDSWIKAASSKATLVKTQPISKDFLPVLVAPINTTSEVPGGEKLFHEPKLY